MGGARSEGGKRHAGGRVQHYVDPEAAKKVFECGAPIVMIPLDCTHKAADPQGSSRQAARRRWGRIWKPSYHLLEWNKRFDEKAGAWTVVRCMIRPSPPIF